MFYKYIYVICNKLTYKYNTVSRQLSERKRANVKERIQNERIKM